MTDDVLVERVTCGVFASGGLQLQFLTRHEPQQRTLALADRAVAGDCPKRSRLRPRMRTLPQWDNSRHSASSTPVRLNRNRRRIRRLARRFDPATACRRRARRGPSGRPGTRSFSHAPVRWRFSRRLRRADQVWLRHGASRLDLRSREVTPLLKLCCRLARRRSPLRPLWLRHGASRLDFAKTPKSAFAETFARRLSLPG